MVLRYIFKKFMKIFKVTKLYFFNSQPQRVLWLNKLLSAVCVPRAWRGGGGGGGGVEEGGLVLVCVKSSYVIRSYVLHCNNNW